MKILVTSVELLESKNGDDYFRLTFFDEDRVSRNAVMFFDRSDVKQYKGADPQSLTGKVYEVSLKDPPASNPNYNPRVLSMTELPEEDPTVFYETSELDVEEMMAYIKERTRDRGNLTTIVDNLVFHPALTGRYQTWPAARKNHHAFQSGLLEHTYAMLKAAEFLIENDPAYAGVDAGVVYCAVALHDFGKIFEYEWEAPGPAQTSTVGRLLGHITMADELVVRVCQKNQIKNNEGQVLNLRHCLLSHHGILKWGSPVRPSTREAILLHQLDMIQSRGQIVKEGYKVLKDKDSEWNKALETELVKI